MWTKPLRLSLYFNLDCGVAVGGSYDLVGNALRFLLNFIELASHEPLDRVNGIAGIRHRLTLGGPLLGALLGGAEGRGHILLKSFGALRYEP